MNPCAAALGRRRFLQCTLGAGASLLLGPSCALRSAPRNPLPCPPTAWTKHGVILEATEPWEGDHVQNFTTRAEPLGKDRWRIWYSVSGSAKTYSIAFAEGRPGEPMKKTSAALTSGPPVDGPFSIGNLPNDWRPVQPVHLQLRNGQHRLYFWAHGPSILRYLAAESDDGRRYRVLDPLRPVLHHTSDRAAFGVLSPDGFTLRKKGVSRPAEEPLAASGLISNDATNVYQLPDGSFEMYTVSLVPVPRTDPAFVAEDNAPGLLRVVDRLTSGDGLHFENRRRVIQRDAGDPADQQFYYLAMTLTDRGRVGTLGHYRCAAQTMDLEWCFSQDGVSWERPLRRGWIQRDAPPAPDCYGIYAGSQIVHHEGCWHLFYTGVNHAHNGKQTYGKARQVVMWATTKSLWDH